MGLELNCFCTFITVNWIKLCSLSITICSTTCTAGFYVLDAFTSICILIPTSCIYMLPTTIHSISISFSISIFCIPTLCGRVSAISIHCTPSRWLSSTISNYFKLSSTSLPCTSTILILLPSSWYPHFPC